MVKRQSHWKKWEIIRKKVYKRDGYKCKICGNKETLIAHHWDRNRNHDTLNNLITLCFPCHMKIHKIYIERLGTRKGIPLKEKPIRRARCIFCNTIFETKIDKKLFCTTRCQKNYVQIIKRGFNIENVKAPFKRRGLTLLLEGKKALGSKINFAHRQA